MRVSQISRQSLALILAMAFLFATVNTLLAQASANHTANITADEFTARSGNMGWNTGNTVPNLKFNDVYTKKFSLYDKLEKPTVIELYNFEDPNVAKDKTYLKSFYKQYDINIISICNSDYPNKIRQFVKNNELSWPNVQDDSKKFTGMTLAQNQNMGNTKFLFITPDKQVHTVVANGEPVGKLGAALQNYFSNK